MKRILWLPLIFFLLVSVAFAKPGNEKIHLNSQDVDRVKICHEILLGVDERSLEQMIDEIKTSDHPQANLIILEAMARVYADIANELKIVENDSRKRLLSKVKLNMAYLQLNNFDTNANGSEPLSRLIVRKLKKNLPQDLANKPGFGFSLE